MTTLRRFRALPVTVKSADTIGMVEKIRSRAGLDATMLTVRAKPQTNSRKPRL
jgi:hypothetical protein